MYLCIDWFVDEFFYTIPNSKAKALYTLTNKLLEALYVAYIKSLSL